MTGDNVTEQQWQKVFSIVRKYQRNMAGNRYYENDYAELSNVLDELYPLAYASKEQQQMHNHLNKQLLEAM